VGVVVDDARKSRPKGRLGTGPFWASSRVLRKGIVETRCSSERSLEMGRVGEEVKGWRWSGSKLCEMATFLGGGFLSKDQGIIYPARMSRDHTSEAYRVKKTE
jgi:hypothetical protein